MGFNSRQYRLTLQFIFLRVINKLYPEWKVIFRNSLNNGVYITIENKDLISEDEIKNIENEMRKIIEKGLTIERKNFNSELLEIENIKKIREDLKEILENTGIVEFYIYELDGYRDFFIEELYENTNIVKIFKIFSYDRGIILKSAEEIDGELKLLPEIDDKKLFKTLVEGKEWNDIMNVSYLGSLNKINLEGRIKELIRVNEALHSKKISNIIDELNKNEKIKLITIAGPSSSGKTTFSNKLKLHLLASKRKPILISLDDYYIDRNRIPVDENGEKDFEALEALDINLLNENMRDLMNGKEVEVPLYDFTTGERKSKGKKLKLEKNGILIIEGIHGLNEKLLSTIEKNSVYKIYVSCLTQLNIDAHNRIKTSEVRKIRRIVRDSIFRGFNAEGTLKMWKKVRKGEDRNIFPYQENADIIFDTSLTYEVGVLKPKAERELIKIKPGNEYYKEARKLLRMLSYFTTIEEKYVPTDSLLREFIGGSCFYEE